MSLVVLALSSGLVRERKTVMSEGVAAATVLGTASNRQRPKKKVDSGVLGRCIVWPGRDLSVSENSRKQVSTVSIFVRQGFCFERLIDRQSSTPLTCGEERYGFVAETCCGWSD